MVVCNWIMKGFVNRAKEVERYPVCNGMPLTASVRGDDMSKRIILAREIYSYESHFKNGRFNLIYGSPNAPTDSYSKMK